MDRVEGSQRRLGQRPRAGKQSTVERPQCEHIDQFTCTFQQQVEREGGIRRTARRTARGISARTSSLLTKSAPST